MHTRKSHNKSRNGCEACKRRRVKCDEQKPSCGQCKLRSLDCNFPEPVRSTTAIHDQSESSVGTASTQRTTSSQELFSLSDNRSLELELMLKWSTSTYKSMCIDLPDEDQHVWQVLIPTWALQHDFLLYGIFTVSALEISMSSDSDLEKSSRYLQIALECHGLALGRFRTAIDNIDESNHNAVFTFSLIAVVLSIIIPQCEDSSMIGSMIVNFEMMIGLGNVILSSMEWLLQGPFKTHFQPLETIPMDDLDEDTKVALERLNAVNEERNDPTRQDSRASKLQAMSHHSGNRTAIFYLEELFARVNHRVYRGLSIGWLAMAGHEYVKAMKESEPVALLVLMHWGILAHKAGYDAWWAKGAGRSLVDEICSVLSAGNDANMGASITYCREQVGLQGVRAPFAGFLAASQPTEDGSGP